MRKYFLSLVALAAGLFATSCQESLVEPQVAGPTTFTVQLPDAMGTKAEIGSANTVNQLFVSVYAPGCQSAPLSSAVVEKVEGDGTFTVSFNLIQDQTYDLIFWAQTTDTYVKKSTTVDATYDLRTIDIEDRFYSDENGAAFYAYQTYVIDGQPKEATLRRPFAQLNIGTTVQSLTTDAGNVKITGAKIKVENVASSFNTVKGFGEGNTTIYGQPSSYVTVNPQGLTKVIAVNGTDYAKLEVGGESYVYVTMDYLPIISSDSDTDPKDLVNINLLIDTDQPTDIEHNFHSVPVQRNYRTNIIGNLISSTTDFNVVVDADFAKDENGQLYPDNDILVVENAAAAQAALDNAKPGDVIELVAGVNYGTLYLRPVKDSPATKEVDWIGNNYRWETYTLFENITILGAEGATVDAIEIEGGTYYNTEHSQMDKYPVMLSLIELRDVEIDGVTFTGKGGYDPQGHGNAINLSGSNIKVDGLTLKNCVLDNPSNNARLIYKTESTTTEHKYTYDSQTKASQEYTFTPSLKDITITGTTFNGGYMGLELRETNNVTITDNVFNVGDRNILLASNSGCTYSGKVTIIGNVSNNAKERFVRMSGAGDAEVVIKDNYIYNYQGADADYIKVTDGTNVTIENNVFGKFVYGLTLIPDGENSKIIVRDEEGFLNLTRLFAEWTALFTDRNGNAYSNYANGAGVDYYYGGRWTVSLEADIDLNNEIISPVILKHPVQTGAPTFDGNNHTIKNAKIVTDATTGNEAGLFDASHNNALKNLKLDNIHVTGSNVGNSTAGVLSGSVNADQGVQNITITNSSVTGGKYTGGVIGYGYTDVINCSLTNVTVNGGYKLGGLIGYICASSGTGDVIGNTLTDCTVNGIGGGVYAGGKTEYIIGKVVGNYNCNGTCKDNTITNMTTEATSLIGKIEAGKNVTIENNVCVYYVTPSNHTVLTLESNSIYYFRGDFNSSNVSLVMAKGVENVIFDGTDARNINELIITQNGALIDNANTPIGDRSGKVTVQNFNVLSQINLFACKTEVVVQENSAEALMVYAGNCDVKVLNNNIDANFESHPTYRDADNTWNTNNYGIALNIFDYNLWLDGNTVTDALGHAIGINGWETTIDNGDENKIESFKNNNITVNSTTNTKRAAFKVWDDETYASNDDDTNVINPTAQAFINAVLADNSNKFNIIEGYDHTIFSFYNVNTNE